LLFSTLTLLCEQLVATKVGKKAGDVIYINYLRLCVSSTYQTSQICLEPNPLYSTRRITAGSLLWNKSKLDLTWQVNYW